MPMGKDSFFMFALVISAILFLSVHWFLGVANFIISYGYMMGE
ncbi:MAG: hypothetical protein ABIG96_03400 [Candidatus Micrarchaeota archaeon]